MKSQKAAYIPAILITLVSIVLIAYSFYAMSNGAGHPPPQGGPRPPGGGHKEAFEPFKLMGTIAVICGAISFFWLRFKKKLTSKSPVVKQMAKLFYKVHQVTGWAALILIVAHGAYYLITKLQDDKIYTGLAAFLILLALGGYGWMIRRARNPWVRKVHLLLSIVWIPALLLHAGGSAILTGIITLVLWGGVSLLERATQPKPVANQA